jgi:exosome complex RNA-binding protein Csl4
MNAIVEMRPAGGALASTQASGRMALAEIIQHISLVQEVMHTVMKPDVHYGKIPGTDKPTLYKNGAEVLCMVFRIAQSYEVVDMSTADVVRYRSVCTGTHQVSGLTLGSGMGGTPSFNARSSA